MFRKIPFATLAVFLLLILGLIPVLAQEDEFVFGMILVGARDDHGWSQAHYEGGQYVEEKIPGTRMIVFDRLNPADAPETRLQDVVSDMVNQGARLIFTTSDEFKSATDEAAREFPDVIFINIAGDTVLAGSAPPNVGNLMGQMEWAKLIAGCAAGLRTRTGKIGYLGPLINYETRRLVVSAYLGARYCYQTHTGGGMSDFSFTVTWIGFWFNIPGVTLDPTEVTNTFFDNGADVVISGIDTTEAIVVAGQRAANGESVFAVPYDFAGACELAPDVCLGVPYFHWGPTYKGIVESVQAGTWESSFDWVGPDWSDINNPDTSAIGFVKGAGLGEEASAALDAFIAQAAVYAEDPANENSFWLWEGPLNYQDGTEIAAEGPVPAIAPLGETPSVWYLEQLLEGMIGASSSQ